MKILKSAMLSVGILLMSFGVASCTDWGESDPVAGGDIFPDRQVVATFPFQYEDALSTFNDMDFTNSLAEVVNDADLGSDVLHVDGTGYVRIANPFNNVKLQNGAGITFWVKTTDEALDRALLAFAYDLDDEAYADSARFYFTRNAQLVYTKPGQLQSRDLNENDPEVYQTNLIGNESWHFVALQVSNNGYQLFVDGYKTVSATVDNPSSTSFSYKTLVKFLNDAPYIYIGKGSAEDASDIRIDDLRLIRNQMTAKDWARPNISGGGGNENKVYVPVGNEDCSAAWWTEFSDYFTIPANNRFHTRFINHTNGANNWNNWVLVVTTDDVRGGGSYSEYFVIRADIYGWGNGDFTLDNMSSEGFGDWDAFRANMEGAVVDLSIERSGKVVTVTAVMTCENGTVYKETYHQVCGDGTQPIRAFLTVDGSYLELDAAETIIGNTYEQGSYLVGNADFTSGWWSAFSDFYNLGTANISNDCPFIIKFVNNQSGMGSNWNNWILVCTNGVALGGEGYFENYVLRSDAYGWFMAGGNTADNSAGLDFTMNSAFDWTTYVSDMSGATCWLKITRTGNSVRMDARQQKQDGTLLPDYNFTYNSLNGNSIGFFLTAEMASLDMLAVGYMPYYDKLIEE